MKLTMGELRLFIEDASSVTKQEWSVRGGRELLVRGVDEPPQAWKWQYFQKVLYFDSSELVHKPRGPTDQQVWTFRRGNMLYAVAERDFYSRPV